MLFLRDGDAPEDAYLANALADRWEKEDLHRRGLSSLC